MLKPLTLILISLLFINLSSCSDAESHPSGVAEATAVPSEPQKTEPSPSPVPDSSIRSVDFENFAYPEIEGRGTFRLRDGVELAAEERRSVVDVVYYDVTADGVEEALVVHSQNIKGSAIPYFVYIYTLTKGKPKLIWSFYAGERGDGGLRKISSADGQLLVELYGKDRIVNGGTSSEEDNYGVCCPRFFTRSIYEWRGGSFRLIGKEAGLPNPQGNAAYLPLQERLDQKMKVD